MPDEKEILTLNLRVYGLLIKEDAVLITDENRHGIKMTKFPGGGLEMGEGLADCVKREFMEELELEITVGELYYTNDFLQISRFKKSDQLHSFYYHVEAKSDIKLPTEIDLNALAVGEQSFRWVQLTELDSGDFTFPLDQIVVDKLKA